MGRFSPSFNPMDLYVPNAAESFAQGVESSLPAASRMYTDVRAQNMQKAENDRQAIMKGWKPTAPDPHPDHQDPDGKPAVTGGSSGADTATADTTSTYGRTTDSPGTAFPGMFPTAQPTAAPAAPSFLQPQQGGGGAGGGYAGVLDQAAGQQRPFSGGAATSGGAAPSPVLPPPPRMPEVAYTDYFEKKPWTFDPNFQGDVANRQAEDLTIRGINRRRPAVDEMVGAGMIPKGGASMVAQEPDLAKNFPYFNTYAQAFPERSALLQQQNDAAMQRLRELNMARWQLEKMRMTLGANSPQYREAVLRLGAMAARARIAEAQAHLAASQQPSGTNAMLMQPGSDQEIAAMLARGQQQIATGDLSQLNEDLSNFGLDPINPDAGTGPAAAPAAPAAGARGGKGRAAPAPRSGGAAMPGVKAGGPTITVGKQSYYMVGGKIPVTPQELIDMRALAAKSNKPFNEGKYIAVADPSVYLVK